MGLDGDDDLFGEHPSNATFGNDILDGGAGSDELSGGGGNDTLIGGSSQDYLTGEAGADTFLYNASSDSTTAANDIIFDFSTAQGDKIDLTALIFEAQTNLTFIDNAAFSGSAGQVRWESAFGTDILVQCDTDGVGGADLEIWVWNKTSIAVTDFIGVDV